MKPSLDSFSVDLANPEEIRKSLPKLEEIVAQKGKSAREAQHESEAWSSLLSRLKFLAGLVVQIEMPRPPKFISSPEAVDAVVHIVERENRPIMPLGVEEGLLEEGHEVESRDAVEAALMTAARDGRIQHLDETTFAPNSLDPELWRETPAIQAVPEAHFGLEGPMPQTKAEAVVRVLASQPNEPWTTPEVAQAMIAQGWMSESENDMASVASSLSRLHAQHKIFRPVRGHYQLAPPNREGDK